MEGKHIIADATCHGYTISVSELNFSFQQFGKWPLRKPIQDEQLITTLKSFQP